MRIKDTKPVARIADTCLLNQLGAVPQLSLMKVTMDSVKPGDCFLVRGCAASAPDTTAVMSASADSDASPTFSLSLDKTARADLGLVKPKF